MDWNEHTICITGGTGSFGRRCAEILIAEYHPRRVIILSRDEYKQAEMRHAGLDDPRLSYIIGDVRDQARLQQVLAGVDILIHAAALKQVPTCEAHPSEAVKTNIQGAQNVIDAALMCGVAKVLALSTDKAVNPSNVYGATKLVAEKLFVQANTLAAAQGTAFACTRYGNVIGSRGSVVPLFLQQRETGFLTITDPQMTRFWLTLEQSVRFVISAIEWMAGGEIFVPKVPSMRITDLATALAPGCVQRVIGVRPGEKIHEDLVSVHESFTAFEADDHYVIAPLHARPDAYRGLPQMAAGTGFSSHTNKRWLSVAALQALLH